MTLLITGTAMILFTVLCYGFAPIEALRGYVTELDAIAIIGLLLFLVGIIDSTQGV